MNAAQQQLIAGLPPMTENAVWRRLSPREGTPAGRSETGAPNGRSSSLGCPIECERFHLCGEDAVWASRQGHLCVCDYHRFLFEIERTLQSIGAETLAVQNSDRVRFSGVPGDTGPPRFGL